MSVSGVVEHRLGAREPAAPLHPHSHEDELRFGLARPPEMDG